MLSDYKPIIFDTPFDFPEIEVYFAHDVHRGNECHDEGKWKRFKKEILSEPNRYVMMVGDYCENIIPGSKGDIFTQRFTPQEQKEWFTEQLKELSDRVMCIVPGNHENNRITKTTGIYPAYDCAVMAGLEKLYRQHFAFVDIGVGNGQWKDNHRQTRYYGFATHRMKDLKGYGSYDFVDGIDFAVSGHDHDPHSHPRGKLVYDGKAKVVRQKDIFYVDAGSFLTYGGYAVDGAYRPNSTVLYKLILSGARNPSIKSVGFTV